MLLNYTKCNLLGIFRINIFRKILIKTMIHVFQERWFSIFVWLSFHSTGTIPKLNISTSNLKSNLSNFVCPSFCLLRFGVFSFTLVVLLLKFVLYKKILFKCITSMFFLSYQLVVHYIDSNIHTILSFVSVSSYTPCEIHRGRALNLS